MRAGLTYEEAGKLGAIAYAKTAATLKQQRVDNWNNNPKLCKACSSAIPYEKRQNNFCSHKCSAAFNNKGIRRNGNAPISCLNCATETHNPKFCSSNCALEWNWKEAKQHLIDTGVDESCANKIGKRYLIELHGRCQQCLSSEWQGKAIPLVLDHINGNPYDNSLPNLRVICPNCDAQTPTFAGRNRGNGRFERAKRYKFEKDTFCDLNRSQWKH
jgi:predicted nucleic acid-binding Zn ribbon protein